MSSNYRRTFLTALVAAVSGIAVFGISGKWSKSSAGAGGDNKLEKRKFNFEIKPSPDSVKRRV